jgi:hypothetical protein
MAATGLIHAGDIATGAVTSQALRNGEVEPKDLSPTTRALLQNAKGDNGLSGPAGSNGANGPNRANGTNGVDGIDGPDGIDGRTASTGPWRRWRPRPA